MNLQNILHKFYYSATLWDLRLIHQRFTPKTITYNSLLYLEIIYAMNGKCTASKLANLLYVSKPAVTLKVNELIKDGFIQKIRDPKDQRKNYLFVNEAFLSKYRLYRKEDAITIEKLIHEYPKEEIAIFCKILDRIATIYLEEEE